MSCKWYISSAASDDVVGLVSAGWSWLLSPCDVCVGAGGAEVVTGGGAGGAAPRTSQTRARLDTV